MKLYLIPASLENATRSLIRPVSLAFAELHLDNANVRVLKDWLNGRDNFNCWAMTGKKPGIFEEMLAGEYLFFALKGSGRFDLLAVC